MKTKKSFSKMIQSIRRFFNHMLHKSKKPVANDALSIYLTGLKVEVD